MYVKRICGPDPNLKIDRIFFSRFLNNFIKCVPTHYSDISCLRYTNATCDSVWRLTKQRVARKYRGAVVVLRPGRRKSPAVPFSLFSSICLSIFLSLSPSHPISPRRHLSTHPRRRRSFHRPGKLPRLARTRPSIRPFPFTLRRCTSKKKGVDRQSCFFGGTVSS